MDWIQNLLGNALVNALGWTLVHSVWQISIWAMVAVTMLIITHKNKAKIRYGMLAIVFLGICTTSTITFRNHYIKANSDPENQAVSISGAGHTVNTESGAYQPVQGEATEKSTEIIAWFHGYFNQHLPGIVTVWFLGFLFFFLRYIGGIAWLMRLKSTSEIITGEYEDVLYKYCRKMKLRKFVDIGKSIKINSPMIIGHFKPIILFPAQILTGLSQDQIESVLFHELAHAKRNDFLVNLVQSFIEIVFFYHPAIWWLSASISTEREHVCDDLAIKGGVDANQMVETLVKLAEVFTRSPKYSQAFSGNQYRIKNRIHRLIFNEKMKTNLNQKVFIGLAITVSVVALSFTVKSPDNVYNKSYECEITEPLKIPAEEVVETGIFTPEQPASSEIPHPATNLPAPDKNSISKEKERVETKTVAEEVQNETVKESYQEDGDDDEEKAGTLKILMKKGAKEWNKYRENHPGENFDEKLKESNLTGFDLSRFNLSNMNLKEADLTSCNFTNANMAGVNIKEAELSGAILKGANLTDANMKELVLTGINLKGAVLKGANLKEISLTDCDLSGSNLAGTVMYEAVIQNCNFKGAVADHTTQFPPGFDWAAQGIEFK
jgi:beta-lactamase regulating signal transducer with metallopeptidase domain